MTLARVICCSVALLLTINAAAQSLVSSSRSIASPIEPVVVVTPERSHLARAYLKGSGSLQGSLGYAPGFIFGVGFDHRFSRVLVLSDVSLDTAKKFKLTGGRSYRAGAGIYAMKKHIGIGGGARCNKLITSAYEKSACRPFIGGVYNSPMAHFDAAFYFPGSDKVNRLTGVRTMTLLPMSNRLAFEFEFGLYRFSASNGSRMHTGIVSNPGMRFMF